MNSYQRLAGILLFVFTGFSVQANETLKQEILQIQDIHSSYFGVGANGVPNPGFSHLERESRDEVLILQYQLQNLRLRMNHAEEVMQSLRSPETLESRIARDLKQSRLYPVSESILRALRVWLTNGVDPSVFLDIQSAALKEESALAQTLQTELREQWRIAARHAHSRWADSPQKAQIEERFAKAAPLIRSWMTEQGIFENEKINSALQARLSIQVQAGADDLSGRKYYHTGYPETSLRLSLNALTDAVLQGDQAVSDYLRGSLVELRSVLLATGRSYSERTLQGQHSFVDQQGPEKRALIVMIYPGWQAGLVDDFLELIAEEAVLDNLKQHYGEIRILKGRDTHLGTLLKALDEFQERGLSIDVITQSHGSEDSMLMAGVILAKELSAYAGRYPALRLVYMMGCYNGAGPLLDAWIEMGADGVLGHVEINNPAFSFTHLLRTLSLGLPLEWAATWTRDWGDRFFRDVEPGLIGVGIDLRWWTAFQASRFQFKGRNVNLFGEDFPPQFQNEEEYKNRPVVAATEGLRTLSSWQRGWLNTNYNFIWEQGHLNLPVGSQTWPIDRVIKQALPFIWEMIRAGRAESGPSSGPIRVEGEQLKRLVEVVTRNLFSMRFSGFSLQIPEDFMKSLTQAIQGLELNWDGGDFIRLSLDLDPASLKKIQRFENDDLILRIDDERIGIRIEIHDDESFTLRLEGFKPFVKLDTDGRYLASFSYANLNLQGGEITVKVHVAGNHAVYAYLDFDTFRILDVRFWDLFSLMGPGRDPKRYRTDVARPAERDLDPNESAFSNEGAVLSAEDAAGLVRKFITDMSL